MKFHQSSNKFNFQLILLIFLFVDLVFGYPDSSSHIEYFSNGGRGAGGSYKFYPVAANTKCFSFHVRTKGGIHVALSNETKASPGTVEVILGYDLISVIRVSPNYSLHLATADTPGIVNEYDFRGFWIRWSNDRLVEVGKHGMSEPFLSYFFPNSLPILYTGVLTWKNVGSWFIDKHPNCFVRA